MISALRLGFSASGFDIRQEQVDATRQRIAKFAKQEVRALTDTGCVLVLLL